MGIAVSPARRANFPAQLEDEFRDEHFRDSLSTVRISVILGVVLLMGFAYLDTLVIPGHLREAWIARYLVAVPLLVIGILATFTPLFGKYMRVLLPPTVSLGALLVGISVIYTAAVVGRPDLAVLAYSANIVLIVVFAYTLAHTLFVWDALTSIALSAVYVAVLILRLGALDSVPSTAVLISNGMMLLGANCIGMFASYFFEYYARRDFLQRRQIREEQENSERLLLNILPREIATTLKARGNPIAEEYAEATILFSDIVGFTPLSASLTPHALLHLLNEVFSAFDEIVGRHGAEKIKTIGDCYMVTVGVPQRREDHAIVAVQIALDMRRYLEERTAAGAERITMRTGLHSGPVVAGVIGHRKFIYDLWGDTVNTASRMESHCAPGQIQITETTYQRVRERFECVSRGRIEVKGKGEMETWFVTGER